MVCKLTTRASLFAMLALVFVASSSVFTYLDHRGVPLSFPASQ
nr:MAG TPA: hypothetical protein [Caudoviricetes sp.]